MRSLRTQLFSPDEWAALMQVLGLSPRQEGVLAAIINGMSDKEIAAKMNVQPTTTRTHLRRLYTKLGVRDRTELVVHCFLRYRQEVSSD